MKDSEKELWNVIDQAIFKTDDPEKTLQKVKVSGAAWLKERSSFGGSLRQLRRGRKWSPQHCAEQLGISQKKWQSWEANRETPTNEELDHLCKVLNFGDRNRNRFLTLLSESPRHRLLMFCRFRPESLAARGVAKLEVDLERQKLPEALQAKLQNWSKARNLASVEELSQYLQELSDDQSRENWVNEVLEGHA